MNRSVWDVVCDAGPLIHLDELGCLDSLAYFRTVFVPEQVWREVEFRRPEALDRSRLVVLADKSHPSSSSGI